jgi:hypothetical protein
MGVVCGFMTHRATPCASRMGQGEIVAVCFEPRLEETAAHPEPRVDLPTNNAGAPSGTANRARDPGVAPGQRVTVDPRV